MSELIIALDGITFQHAGELFEDTAVTAGERRGCKETYLKCFEDVCFAILFADRIAVNDKLPKVGSTSPGESLKQIFHDLVLPINLGQAKVSTDELLAEAQFKEDVIRDLSNLDSALTKGRVYWEQFMTREAPAYLGADSTLSDDSLAPDEFKFKGDDHYIKNGELQMFVPASYVNRLMETVEGTQAAKDAKACDEALREFNSRVALTHVVNHWWNRRAIRGLTEHKTVSLPHVTRAILRNQETDQSNFLGKFQRTLFPYVGSLVVCALASRTDLPSRLWDLRTQFQSIRQKLRNVVDELNVGNESSAGILCSEIERVTTGIAGDVADAVTLVNRFGFHSSVDAPAGKPSTVDYDAGLEAIRALASPETFAIRQLREATTAQYRGNLAKLFPELRME